MLSNELSRIVHDIGTLEEYAVKTAEVKDTALIGCSNAYAASAIYAVMAKEASFTPDGSNPIRMCKLLIKVAKELAKPEIDTVTQLKIATAVTVDDALETAICSSKDTAEKAKIAELQAYGREYLIDLLRGVI